MIKNLRLHGLGPGDVYVGRAGRGRDGYFGNPFDVRTHGIGQALDRYREYAQDRMYRDITFRRAVAALDGKDLVCFCVDQHGNGRCHGHILAELARIERTLMEDQP